MATSDPLTLNSEQHVLLSLLLDGNTAGGWDLYILEMVITQGHSGCACTNLLSSAYHIDGILKELGIKSELKE